MIRNLTKRVVNVKKALAARLFIPYIFLAVFLKKETYLTNPS